MYFFNIKALKQDINQGKPTTDDRYVLPYLICYFVLSFLATTVLLLLEIEFTVWDQIDILFGVLIAGPAVFYLYRSNRDNPAGSFLSNLVLISWVCGFRFYAVVIPILALLSLAGEIYVIASMLFNVLYIVYVARHIRSVKSHFQLKLIEVPL